ncbi:MAG: hypothetical protein SOW59_05480 [Corynebacterium sp.]|nr:hypothetical protein [Corynebacterium sp.]
MDSSHTPQFSGNARHNDCSLAQEVCRLKKINEVPIRPALAAWVCGSLTYALASSEVSNLLPIAILSGGITAYSAATIIRRRPRMRIPTLMEWKKGDYTAIAYIAQYASFLCFPLSFSFQEVSLAAAAIPSWLHAFFSVLIFLTGVIGPVLSSTRVPYAIGKRRALRIIADDELSGVTEQRLDATEQQATVLSACAALGAIDGNVASLHALTSIVSGLYPGTDLGNIESAVKELEAHGLTKITNRGIPENPEGWEVTLTPIGVRCLQQLRSR